MATSKRWRFIDPGPDMEPIESTWTEERIMQEYWPYWVGEMLKVHKLPMITEENCIEDFVVVNWAWEVE